ncbi:MAG TPA: Fic family protein [Thermoanaerobaculia bacterium]|nr:Fic family protein [Thermoanaerobaculia bacterium]
MGLPSRLAQNHAFVDGNKRIAWATTRAFLLVNGIGIEAPVAIGRARRPR